MNSFSIAFDNFKRNIKVYSLYIMSMIFSVIVFYNFVALKYNPDFQKANETNSYIKGTSIAVSYLLLLFIIFFIWFSSSFFLKQRKREIGIYAFMGVSNTQIALIYSIELIFMGITATAVGLILGVVFCKLFLMMLAKVALLNMKIGFFISTKAIIQTTVAFFVIFFVNSVLGYINIVRSKLIDLINASKREERLPKVNYVKGLLSLICISVGYYFALHARGEKFEANFLIAIIFVILGTYWFFGSVYSIIMKFIINRKKILYNGVNIVSMSNIAFRIKNNYRTLAAVAILATITLTSYGTVASLRYFVQIRDAIQKPYEISYMSSDDKVKQQVRDKLASSKKDIILEESTEVIVIKPHIYAEMNLQLGEYVALKYSDFIKISSDLKVKDLKNFKKEKLAKGEILYVSPPSVVMSLYDYKNVKATITNKNYTIKNTLKTPILGSSIPLCLILNDEDYNLLRSTSKIYEVNGIKINNTDNIKLLEKELITIKPIKNSLHVNVSKDKSFYSVFGIVYFLGAFLSLVFIIATGSIIYFKLISEAYLDKDKYVLLKRLGMTNKEIFRATTRQIGISYLLPLVVGIIHSCVAMSVLSKLIDYNILTPATSSIITFIVVYVGYFVATTRKYMKIVM
ncbi:ABC transporter permease [Clostridium estertheticum]|uniref:FtsX-like permease family protein n=1 Tax=Clostridium estertheticum TaxID=238834 RepID=UPI001CF0E91E|nr:ABC transporter permease [Clostridium estertheticum]MCB2305740.1 ABC transporter permease [Clostridium estertheticum]MCB2347083.1 ABC transporter permease [Clostridium estertheticum]MCB2348095.1 ABC transporter permease [Clostridium estertheticum]WAG45735.1 ABC transporter permease [Clostridium estertheticum]